MSADKRDPTYFAYYGRLVHQQNMLSDSVRTSLYRSVCEKFSDQFKGKVVMDLGAGSGVLSFFAAQVGATQVHAIEASDMARKLELFITRSREEKINTWLDECKFSIHHGKIEEVCEKDIIQAKSVDTIISEPIGVFLVHERMLESFLLARDVYLKPNGTIFPTTGSIHVAPFTDATLWSETMSKARWWEQKDFYGIDFSPMVDEAKKEAFESCVIGQFMPQLLMTNLTCSYEVDFRTVEIKELYDILIPCNWISDYTGVIHGIAGWFDCGFGLGQDDANHIHLSTNPAQPVTHWQQIRFVLQQPLASNVGDYITGWIRLTANEMRSYNVEAEIWIEDAPGQRRKNSFRTGRWDLHEQIFYYPQFTQQPQQQQSQLDAYVPEHFGLYNN